MNVFCVNHEMKIWYNNSPTFQYSKHIWSRLIPAVCYWERIKAQTWEERKRDWKVEFYVIWLFSGLCAFSCLWLFSWLAVLVTDYHFVCLCTLQCACVCYLGCSFQLLLWQQQARAQLWCLETYSGDLFDADRSAVFVYYANLPLKEENNSWCVSEGGRGKTHSLRLSKQSLLVLAQQDKEL